MSRCAVMVDAGYVYAEGGRLCCGTRSRADTRLDPGRLVEWMSHHVSMFLRVQVLRTYWYDAARDGIRTTEQREIAALSDVKLRLGRLNGQNQQKGVDALVYRDMITLAQHNAVSDIVLLSGDEDLREGVRTVQDYGVRVTLTGIEAVSGHNQSEELVYEADRLWILSKEDLSDFFSPRTVEKSERITAEIAARARSAAVSFAIDWRERVTDAELAELSAERPRIPRPLDIEPITTVERAIGVSLIDQQALKNDLRAAWWGVIGGRRVRPERVKV